MNMRDGSSAGGDYNLATSVISTHEHKRQRGEPMLIQRVVFYDGMVYQIEEEIYSDEDHSSVYTSEDSFEEDDKLRIQLKQQTASRNLGTAGTIPNSIQSSNLDGFIEHKVNI